MTREEGRKGRGEGKGEGRGGRRGLASVVSKRGHMEAWQSFPAMRFYEFLFI